MAVGDDASAAGYPLVPPTGSDDAKVRWGYREINRTRDFIAQLGNRIWPLAKGGTGATTKAGARQALGFWPTGTGLPDNSLGEEGDVYFRVVG